jgi:hypothetical protein
MEEFKMTTNSIVGQKWWKIGAAAFLSVGLLAACETEKMILMLMTTWKKMLKVKYKMKIKTENKAQ